MTMTAAPDRPGTGSDLHPTGGEETAPKKASRQILRHAIEEGLELGLHGTIRSLRTLPEEEVNG